jgi:hypothetical protein
MSAYSPYTMPLGTDLGIVKCLKEQGNKCRKVFLDPGDTTWKMPPTPVSNNLSQADRQSNPPSAMAPNAKIPDSRCTQS